jgi:hypothetical protein
MYAYEWLTTNSLGQSCDRWIKPDIWIDGLQGGLERRVGAGGTVGKQGYCWTQLALKGYHASNDNNYMCPVQEVGVDHASNDNNYKCPVQEVGVDHASNDNNYKCPVQEVGVDHASNDNNYMCPVQEVGVDHASNDNNYKCPVQEVGVDHASNDNNYMCPVQEVGVDHGLGTTLRAKMEVRDLRSVAIRAGFFAQLLICSNTSPSRLKRIACGPTFIHGFQMIYQDSLNDCLAGGLSPNHRLSYMRIPY